MFLFGLTGCGVSKNQSASMQNIINLSTSDISSIGISYYGGKQTNIENSKQKEEICSFLSKITLSQKYKEEKINRNVDGGGGAYFLINYSNNSSSHIQIYANNNKVKIISGTKDIGSENEWKVYTISDPSQIANLKEIISANQT